MIPTRAARVAPLATQCRNDEEAAIPKEVLKQFAELGAFGALVPEEYEGAGLNNTQMARLAEVVGANDLSLGVVMGAHQSIGYKGILLYGTDEQKKKYLPDLATGRRFAAFCLTEPSSGSDANSLRSRAEKTADGKHYVLNGAKLWISNGGLADIFTVFAQTPVKSEGGITKDKVSAFIVERTHGGVTHSPPEKKMGIKGSNTAEVNFENTKVPVENLLGGSNRKYLLADIEVRDIQEGMIIDDVITPVKSEGGITKDKVSAFIVERTHGGVTHSPPEKKMGIKGSNTAEVNFENTKVPVENLLGEEGDGFKVAMNILNNGRFGIPAACTGSMKWCIKKTVDHISERAQFGKMLKEFGNVQEQLVDMVTRHYATESIVYMLASNMDKGVQDYQLEAAIGKIMASENAWHVCDAAIQLHGGMGYMKECGLERVLRDLRIFRIFEGANDVLRLFIALTGMQYAGSHLQQVASEIKAGGMSALFGELMRRASRSTGGDFETVVHPSLRDSAVLANKAVKEFGKTAEGLLLKYRKGIIDRQWELIRMADAAIDIYSMVVVLARYTRTANSKLGSAHEENIANLFCSQASKRAMATIQDVQMASEKEIKIIGSVAADICKQRDLIQAHPIDV
ncbi:Very long-chain specific acyl-CoA dehydrogenase, mitochondrial [Toxocara canis]|uniref:Very long-chain specific acyl-CoA dehydrogenase, mitochondrial n=1 Tax=Toxocara canis TaxID=6265 RepID=A0A0B2W019_TOXCA|nr:Very long-chain specific acyl-CoA dehydrogenase, mitochondrial [Toxocara canis]